MICRSWSESTKLKKWEKLMKQCFPLIHISLVAKMVFSYHEEALIALLMPEKKTIAAVEKR
jgi:hypothetical protein